VKHSGEWDVSKSLGEEEEEGSTTVDAEAESDADDDAADVIGLSEVLERGRLLGINVAGHGVHGDGTASPSGFARFVGWDALLDSSFDMVLRNKGH